MALFISKTSTKISNNLVENLLQGGSERTFHSLDFGVPRPGAENHPRASTFSPVWPPSFSHLLSHLPCRY